MTLRPPTPEGEAPSDAAVAPAIVIGIDAGGTYTRAAAATLDGRLVARSRKAGGNPRTVGTEAGRAELRAAVAELRLAAPGRLLHVAIGSAGLVDPAPGEACRGWARHLGAPAATVDSDARIAHAAAFDQQPGIIVVAGTGSQCLAFGPGGERVRVGGWGPTFGDEGSAYWIARRAVATALAALDRREAHPFADALLDAAGVTSSPSLAARHEALLDHLYEEGATPARHATFAVHVAELADAGVGEAQVLLDEAGRELADLASAAAASSGATVVARAGSVLDENVWVRSAFERYCRARGLDVLTGSWDPVVGALRLALRAVGASAAVDRAP